VLSLHRLVLLREVKLRGSMTAAARALSYSHSTVSQQLALLEQEVGVTLLEKVGRNVALTAAGEELVRNSDAILEAVERAESDLATTHHRTQGIVSVAVFPTISRNVMPSVLSALASDHPGLDVRLYLHEADEAISRLISRRVDAVISDTFPGTESPAVPGIHTHVLGADPIRAYLPAGAGRQRSDLARVRWVMEPRTTVGAQWALRTCREVGFEPLVAHESPDLLFHLRLVEQGLAAAFLPDMVLREAGSPLQPSDLFPVDRRRQIVFHVRAGAEAHPSLVAVRDAIELALH
jgi:molybdate transport repressor ModE-like protein